jgi:hypothetical protein
MRRLLISCFAAFSQPALAGGIVSAGEVTLKALVTCQATSIDVTHPSPVKFLSLSKETDYGGNISWENPTLTLQLMDRSGFVLRYLVLEEGSLSNLRDFRIDVLRYRPGSQNNSQLGVIVVRGNSGHLRPNGSLEFEELLLKNCRVMNELPESSEEPPEELPL